MKLLPTATLTLAAFALLTACGPKGGGNAVSGGGAAASGPDVTVNMSDLPKPRAGLWKITMDNGDGKPSTMTTCHSGKTPEIPKMPAGCSQLSIKKTFLGAYVMDMSCDMQGLRMTSHSNVTGDFQGHVVGDSTTTMAMGGKPPQTIKMHTEETWVGPCAPGQEPIDADEKAGG